MTRSAVVIEGIRRGRAKHAPATSPRHTYAVLLDAESRELLVSATLDYILDRVEQLDLEIVSMSTRPYVARPTDDDGLTQLHEDLGGYADPAPTDPKELDRHA